MKAKLGDLMGCHPIIDGSHATKALVWAGCRGLESAGRDLHLAQDTGRELECIS